MTEVQQKFIDLLKEMFQFDQADLDFGIYRVMRLKRKEIESFLNETLPQQISEEVSSVSVGKKNPAEKMKEIEAKANELGIEISASPKLKAEYDAAVKEMSSGIDKSSLENEVYNRLTDFFSRYYDEGDFISQRRYKDGAYAIPYEGEEVKLHWANADQYYVKTSEYFKNYTFSISTGKKVYFKIIEAKTAEENNKTPERQTFKLRKDINPIITDNGLEVFFEYTEDSKVKNIQDKRNKESVEYLVDLITPTSEYGEYYELVKEQNDDSLLFKKIKDYTKRNTFDYFVHKDLRKFLLRELDFYIKNEIINIDDINEQIIEQTQFYLIKAKIIRNIAKQIIDFLAQIENFQRTLLLKKKFVVETNYCITLDKIDEKFYPEIAENEEQRKEWVNYFAIDKIGRDLQTEGYSEPLTVEFLKQNRTLPVDTSFFSSNFYEKITSENMDLDNSLNGELIHGDSYQALKLLEEKYNNKIQFIYIDPPYNTGSDEFLYKDNYKDSSWLSMITDRLNIAASLLKDTGAIAVSIDDNELVNVITVLDNVFGKENQVALIAVKMSRATGVKMAHEDTKPVRYKEYCVIYAKNKENFLINPQYIPTDELDDRYTKFVPNKQDKPEEWKFENLSTYVKAIKSDSKKMLEFYIQNADKICRLADNSQEAFLATKGQKFCQKIQTSTGLDKYAYDGQKVLFYDSKFKTIDGKQVFAENAGDYWSDIVNHVNDLSNEGGVTLQKGKKPEFLLQRLINLCSKENDIILDFCLGSGTTAAVATKLNRRFIGVEVMSYFWSLPLRRMKNVLWGEQRGISHSVGWKGHGALKYTIIESYEDTLNNILLNTDIPSLDFNNNKNYFLSYMLQNESKDSPCLLNTDSLVDPFAYKMKITQNLEQKECSIDLIETFNYLLGLNVLHSAARANYDADFTTGEYGAISAKLKTGNTYTFKMIEGVQNDGSKVLVIWRNLTGDAEKDNAALDAFFAKKHISSHDFEFDKIYVNGDNNLQNVKTEDENWKVVLIESEMKKLMFQGV